MMVGSQSLLLLFMTTLLRTNGQLTSNQEHKRDKLLDRNTCGRVRLQFDDKIINGRPAKLGNYPWMAVIGYSSKPGGEDVQWLCGGSLITDQYVVTAAHCVHPSIIKPFSGRRMYVQKVRLGELDLDPSVVDNANPTDFEIENITWHEDYSNARKENDIALIRLKNKVTFTELMSPICLPPPEFNNNLFVGSFPTVAGWGRTTLIGDPPTPTNTKLFEAEVEVKETSECRKNYTTNISSTLVIDHKVMCASSPDTDTCMGDSGGPLMMVKNGNYFIMGVVSYGFKCAMEGYPGIYMRVSEYMSWLMKNIDV